MQKKQNNVLAVCDVEVDYAYNFMEYLNQRRNLPFEVQAFTSAEILCEYAQNHPIEILLISDKALTDAILHLPVGKMIILSEGVHSPALDQYPSVYKYQASDMVIREVMDLYGAEKLARETGPVYKRSTTVIGVYSPVGRTQKTSFSLTLGQILAKERSVLYLNLESYAGFEQLMEENYDRTLSDLLYYIRQENTGILHKLGGMVRTLSNLDYIPPVHSPMDIQMTTGKEWKRLFDEIVRNSRYEVLILDLGEGVQDLYEILDYCNQIYVPVRQDAISLAKISQFEQILHMWNYDQVAEKIQKIRLPFHTTSRVGKGYLEDLAWSELGDYIRQLRRKEAV